MTVPVAESGFEILAVYGLFVALTTITVALRTYCRTLIGSNSFGWDDGLAIISWAFFMCFSAFAITGVHHGTGQHAWNIKPATEIPIGIKFWWLCEPVYVLSNMAIKASIAVMLLRLMVNPIHRKIIYAVLIPTELFSAAFFFVFVFQCYPSEYFWTRYTGGTGSCIDPNITVNLVYAYSAITCIGDWTYALLPWVLVWDLQMPKKQKFFVGAVLTMGAIASAATIARIPYISSLKNTEDFLYATKGVALWSCCETGLGIAACSCATLRPLFRTWLKPLSQRTSSRLPPFDKESPQTSRALQGHEQRFGNTSSAYHGSTPNFEAGIGKSDAWTVQYELDDARNARSTTRDAARKQRNSSEHESSSGSFGVVAARTHEFPGPHKFHNEF